MPYPDDELVNKEQDTLNKARFGKDETGKPLPKPVYVPPKVTTTPTVRFGKPFSEEERKKQAAAKSNALRSHFAKDDDPGYYGDQ